MNLLIRFIGSAICVETAPPRTVQSPVRGGIGVRMTHMIPLRTELGIFLVCWSYKDTAR